MCADCSGPAIVGTKWLPRAGVPAPKVIHFNPNVRYGCGVYLITTLSFLAAFNFYIFFSYLPRP